jgi:hypothetical protein
MSHCTRFHGRVLTFDTGRQLGRVRR